jgi:hypothetical protein
MVLSNFCKRGIAMTNIILCGDAGDSSVSTALIPALTLYGGVFYAGPGKVFESCASPRFFLGECEEVPQIGLQTGILLFKNSIRQQSKYRIPDRFFCVLQTKNTHAAALLRDTAATVVTCGTSTRDTLSIAGLEGAGAALSLQRNLPMLDGGILEPFDFTVSCSEERSPNQLLSVCAVLLISGADSSKGYNI